MSRTRTQAPDASNYCYWEVADGPVASQARFIVMSLIDKSCRAPGSTL